MGFTISLPLPTCPPPVSLLGQRFLCWQQPSSSHWASARQVRHRCHCSAFHRVCPCALSEWSPAPVVIAPQTLRLHLPESRTSAGVSVAPAGLRAVLKFAATVSDLKRCLKVGWVWFSTRTSDGSQAGPALTLRLCDAELSDCTVTVCSSMPCCPCTASMLTRPGPTFRPQPDLRQPFEL